MHRYGANLPRAVAADGAAPPQKTVDALASLREIDGHRIMDPDAWGVGETAVEEVAE